jgi:hypothetical protein
MKLPDHLALVVGALAAVLVALTAVAVHSLLLLGSGWLAIVVAVGGAAAVAAVGAAYAMAREVDGQIVELAPPLANVYEEPPRRQAVRVREARPGEVPAPYLAAVMKGARATRAALKARGQQQ